MPTDMNWTIHRRPGDPDGLQWVPRNQAEAAVEEARREGRFDGYTEAVRVVEDFPADDQDEAYAAGRIRGWLMNCHPNQTKD